MAFLRQFARGAPRNYSLESRSIRSGRQVLLLKGTGAGGRDSSWTSQASRALSDHEQISIAGKCEGRDADHIGKPTLVERDRPMTRAEKKGPTLKSSSEVRCLPEVIC